MLEKFANAHSIWDAALAFLDYLIQGGPIVMLPIAVVGVVLWFALGYRWALLRRGSRKNVRVLIRRALEIQRSEIYHLPLHRQVIPWAARSNVEIPHRADNQVWPVWAKVK